jgi:hypothetical protein
LKLDTPFEYKESVTVSFSKGGACEVMRIVPSASGSHCDDDDVDGASMDKVERADVPNPESNVNAWALEMVAAKSTDEELESNMLPSITMRP